MGKSKNIVRLDLYLKLFLGLFILCDLSKMMAMQRAYHLPILKGVRKIYINAWYIIHDEKSLELIQKREELIRNREEEAKKWFWQRRNWGLWSW